MLNTLYFATQTGLVIAQRSNDNWRVVTRTLQDQHITSVIARACVILAGTTEGIWRSDDAGQQWRVVNDGLISPHVRWLAYHPDSADVAFASTEPTGIFVSHDGADHWNACPLMVRSRSRISI